MDPKIYKAVATGNLKYLQNLSQNDWDEFGQMKSTHGNTILHISVEYTKPVTTRIITRKCKSLLYEQNLNGDTPLHLAVRQRWARKTVPFLIRHHKERKELLRIVNLKGDTALHEAVRSNNFMAVKLLISEDEELARVNNNEGESPLFIAVDKSRYKIARHILKAVPLSSFSGRKGMNVLHMAVIRSKQSLSYTILHRLCWFISLSSVFIGCLFPLWWIVVGLSYWYMLRLKHFKFSTIGSDFISEVHERYSSALFEADQFGWIPLHYAAYFGNIQVVELFLKLDSSESLLQIKENEGMSALHIAVKGNQTFVVKTLTEKYPYTNEYIDNKGRNAFHVAAEDGKENVVTYFLSRLVFDDLINERDINGNTPLHLAALQQHKTICNRLISRSRVDLRAKNKVGLTAIDLIKSKDIDINLERLPISYVRSLEDLVTIKNIKQDQKYEKLQQIQNEEASSSIMRVKGEEPRKSKHAPEAYKELANLNLLIVTIVATVTFTAAITVPGGYNADSKEHDPGTAILTKKAAFQAFVIANSLAFGFSTGLMTLRLWHSIIKQDEKVPIVLKWSLMFRNFAVLAMVVAFLAGQYVVLANSHALAASAVTVACFAFIALPFAISWDTPIYPFND